MARPRSESAGAAALDVAAQLAFEAGLASVTIEEVSRRSGVAKSTIYRHFGGRNQLLVAALDRVIKPPELVDTGTLQGDLEAFLRSVQPIFANPAVRALSFEIYAASLRDSKLDALRHLFFEGRMGPLVAVVERAVKRGELARSLDLVDAVAIIEGPFIVWSVTDASRIENADIAELAMIAAQRLRQGSGTAEGTC